jgi:hypothetical protein
LMISRNSAIWIRLTADMRHRGRKNQKKNKLDRAV